MTAARFSVKYDGPAVSEDYRIEAGVFGVSLIALAALIRDSHDIVSPDGPRYRVRVRRTGTGTFEVFVDPARFWEVVKTLFKNQERQAMAVMLQLFGSDGLLGLMVWLGGRRPDRSVETDGTSTFWVGNRELTVGRTIGNLYHSREVRESLAVFVQPVTRDSVNDLIISLPGSEPIVITPDDRPALGMSVEEEAVTDQTTMLMLTIEAMSRKSVRWYFRETTIGLLWATIGDEACLRRIRDRSEQFRQGDVLECSVRIRHRDDDRGEGVPDEYTILAVLDHRPARPGPARRH